MARRKKTSPVEDFLELISLLPWWVGVALAAVSYLLLHRMAAPEPLPQFQPGQVSTVVTHTVFKAFAGIGQYVVPLLCLAGAAMSALRRNKRQGLVAQVNDSTCATALDAMTWSEFELLVGESFRQQGYKVMELGGNGPDGGVDLILLRGAEKFFLQCKQWKAYKVGVDVVRELYGVMAAKGAAGGFVVTSGQFTSDAKAFASGRNVQLIDGPMLLVRLKQAKITASASEASTQKTATPPSLTGTPVCPSCAAPMTKRVAKRGENSGGSFWGCSTYPACKGTRPYLG